MYQCISVLLGVRINLWESLKIFQTLLLYEFTQVFILKGLCSLSRQKVALFGHVQPSDAQPSVEETWALK